MGGGRREAGAALRKAAVEAFWDARLVVTHTGSVHMHTFELSSPYLD